MYPNEVLHKSMHVDPIKEGETKTFKLLATGIKKVGRNAAGKPMYNRPAQSLTGECTIYDRYRNKPIVIGNVVSMAKVEQPDGSDRFKYVTKDVYFDRTGRIHLGFDKNNQFAFLMRRNENKSNPFRDKTKKALFYLVDKAEAARLTLQDEDTSLDARLLVRDAAIEDLKLMGKGLGLDTEQDPSMLKAALTKIVNATGGPTKIIKASKNEDLKTRIAIKEGVELMYIKFGEQMWHWFADGKEILTVEPAQNSVDALTEHFLSKAGGPKLRKLNGLVEKHYKVSR